MFRPAVPVLSAIAYFIFMLGRGGMNCSVTT